ncbi:DNA oxidative demethylase AlkB [Rhodopseudomonas sp. B29]|uniref:DNA oxidative demethylase AlkB n=1 Tax=Rhodopseudomonas sp. B29 TaxID=95607 RepID=UPI00034D10FA|nr:DNA oxidative demethylase AlkB [Rhodopseudomonas sp. B29]
MTDLFDTLTEPLPQREEIAASAVLLRGFARPGDRDVLDAIDSVIKRAPFRHMQTPGGHAMSVAMTSCGRAGWVTDRRGYRYAADDPDSGRPWPQMPDVLSSLAQRAAAEAGFADFDPDACLINRYVPGAKMALHQDKDERDFSAPIVSVSLGLPAIFQFGGMARSDKPRRYELRHGDVLVWGGPSRLVYHGVLTLKDGEHPLLGRQRINLTFRKAL